MITVHVTIPGNLFKTASCFMGPFGPYFTYGEYLREVRR